MNDVKNWSGATRWFRPYKPEGFKCNLYSTLRGGQVSTSLKKKSKKDVTVGFFLKISR